MHRHARSCWFTLVGILGLAAGCSTEAEGPLALPLERSSGSVVTAARPVSDVSASPAASTFPRALRMAYVQAVQAEAGADYALVGRGGALTGRSIEQALDLRFDARGVRLSAQSADALPRGWELHTRLTGFRCDGRAQPLFEAEPTVPRTEGAARQRQVVYERGSLSEWYENGPLGLEQGFTIPEAPAGCGPAPEQLGFEVRIDSELTARFLADSGGALELRDDRGVPRAYYSDLYALDAAGKELPAHMEYDELSRTVRLLVDVRDARYPVRVDPLWSQQTKLVASDVTAADYFGSSVALSGDTALIGALSASTGRGKAYVFVRSGTTWTQQARLSPWDGVAGGIFGSTVALSGNTAAIGAPGNAAGGKRSAGQVYVYVRSGTTWSPQSLLSAAVPTELSLFGERVALDGNTLLIGASRFPIGGVITGQAYVFVRSGTSWSQEAAIPSPDRGRYDYFGQALALSGDTAVISARGADLPSATNAGKTFVFTRSGTTWTQQATLTASDGKADDFFGDSVALSNDTLVVGAPFADYGLSKDCGKAYVFVRSGTSWTEEALLLSTASQEDFFGSAVGVSGDTAVVGAPEQWAGSWDGAGQVHVFERSGSPAVWTESMPVQAADPLPSARFGSVLAFTNNTLLVGAFTASVGSAGEAGSAYVFTPKPLMANGASCSDSRQCASGSCVDGVCCNTACGGNTYGDCQACSAAAKGGGVDGVCGAAAKASICRSAAGACDVAEVCDGIKLDCPADVKLSAGTACRAAAGPCDVAERCDGASPECPDDAKVAGGTTCRAASGSCDTAESCDGLRDACPEDALVTAGTVCRAASGPCDLAEVCSGTSAACPSDARAKAGTVCRTASGPCDRAEVCSGTSKSCPADSLLASGTTCRAAAGPCDVAEVCSGTSKSCPADQLQGNTAICRASAGACDSTEFCSGTSAACPADKYKPMIAVCRAATGLCDVAEYCTGDGPICPPDEYQPAGTTCRDETSDCDAAEVCSGTRGSCPTDIAKPDGTACSGGMCRAGMCI